MERHKEAKTHSLSSSQLATRSKRFSQACAQTCAISNILDFISFLFYPYAFCLGCVLSRFGPVHTVFVYCFFSHNSPHCEISPDPLRINCRVTATVTHFSALKSSPFRCSLCVSLNTRHTHTYTLILHTSRRPL